MDYQLGSIMSSLEMMLLSTSRVKCIHPTTEVIPIFDIASIMELCSRWMWWKEMWWKDILRYSMWQIQPYRCGCEIIEIPFMLLIRAYESPKIWMLWMSRNLENRNKPHSAMISAHMFVPFPPDHNILNCFFLNSHEAMPHIHMRHLVQLHQNIITPYWMCCSASYKLNLYPCPSLLWWPPWHPMLLL